MCDELLLGSNGVLVNNDPLATDGIPGGTYLLGSR